MSGALTGLVVLMLAQSFVVGDEIVVSGGVGQPPKRIQTGLKLEVNQTAGTVDVGLRRPGLNVDAPGIGLMGKCVVDPKEPLEFNPPGQDDFQRGVFRETPDVSDPYAALSAREPARRAAAAYALAARARPAPGKPLDREAVSAIEGLLGDTDPRVSRAAIRALVSAGSTGSAREISRLIWAGDDRTAIDAIGAMPALGARWALADLKKLAGRDAGPVGQAARDAVEKLPKGP